MKPFYNKSTIEVIIEWLESWLTFFAFKFIYVLFGAVFSAFIGLFFGKTILGILASLGITGFNMFEIGAFLGFIGSFFGTNYNYAPKKDVYIRP